MNKFKALLCAVLAVAMVIPTTAMALTSNTQTKTEKYYGDINGSGNVTVEDATLIQRYVADLVNIEDEFLPLADVDCDNNVTVIDATCIQRYLAQVDGGELTGQPYKPIVQPTTQPTTIAPTTEPTDPTSTTQPTTEPTTIPDYPEDIVAADKENRIKYADIIEEYNLSAAIDGLMVTHLSSGALTFRDHNYEYEYLAENTTYAKRGFYIISYYGNEKNIVLPQTAENGLILSGLDTCNGGFCCGFNIKHYIDSLTIPDNTSGFVIKNGAFMYNNTLKDLYVGKNVSLEDGAFWGCTSLTTISLPNTLEKIPNKCFYQCKELKEITIPNSVTSLGSYCFSQTSISEIIIPVSVNNISDNAFYDTPTLKDAWIYNPKAKIGYTAFKKDIDTITLHGYKGSTLEDWVIFFYQYDTFYNLKYIN